MNAAMVGRRIAAFRQQQGISTAELAQRIDRSQATVSRIEHGRQQTSLAVMLEIARALRIHPISLFCEDDSGQHCPIPHEAPELCEDGGGCLARLIRAGRLRARLSVAEAAEALEVPSDRLESWESGRGTPPGPVLERMGNLYPVDAEELTAYAWLHGQTPSVARRIDRMQRLLTVFHTCLEHRAEAVRRSAAWSSLAEEMARTLEPFQTEAAEREGDYFSIGHLSDRLLRALQDRHFHEHVEALARQYEEGTDASGFCSGAEAPRTPPSETE
jgi:transcriptional regulator with XRE-family HTH domain